MPKLIFRAALIRFVDLRYDDKAKMKYVKMNFTASFSKPVREAMEWGEPPAGFASAKLNGDITASHMILTPDGKELGQHELQMDISGASSFEVHRVKVGEDSYENELRFQVVTSASGAAARLEAYLEVIGKGTAQLRVNYEQQQPLVTTDTQERLISEEQAHDTSEAKDDDTAADEPGAPLAQAATMGGTHRRKVRTPRTDRGTVN
jgi:hypothetical protein